MSSSLIIELDTFEPAFPVPESQRDAVMRRFSTLLLDSSSPRNCGSNGVVCKARNVFGETFAVKRLRAGLYETPRPAIPPVRAGSGAEAAFRCEYQSQLVVSSLKGFPQLFGYGETDSGPLIIMEWIEGISLAEAIDALSPEKLCPSAVFALGAELFAMLANMDVLSTRPVHRDLSPWNVMLATSERSLAQQVEERSFELRVIDFGSTTVIDRHDPSFTATTNIFRHGTPEYAPPEMLADTLPDLVALRQSPSIDVYAGCSILYEILTGHTTHRIAQHPDEAPYLVKTSADIEPLSIPGYEKQCAAIMAGLKADQQDRPSAAELRDALLGIEYGRRAENTPTAEQGRSETLQPAAHPLSQDEMSNEAKLLRPLDRSHGGGSVKDASFAHFANFEKTSAHPAINRRIALSRRQFLGLAGGIAALCGVGGAAAALYGQSTSVEEPVVAPDEPSAAEDPGLPTAVYEGGALYTAQDPSSGLWGYLNAQRQWAIEPAYAEVPGLFSDGLAAVEDSETSLFGYIGTDGQWRIDPTYRKAGLFGEGLAFVQASSATNGTSLGGWIDERGSWIIEPAFYGGGVFSNGLASFKDSDDNSSRWGYLDKDGNVIIEKQFIDAGAFSDEGLAYASLHIGQYGWIDKDGQWSIEPQYGKGATFSEGLAGFMDPWSEKWGYLDASGQEVIPATYLSVRLFKNGLAACQDPASGLWGFIDESGTWSISPQFARAGDFAHGLAPAQDAETGNLGYIDDTGYWVIPPQYPDVNLNVLG